MATKLKKDRINVKGKLVNICIGVYKKALGGSQV